jgi:hypothetical protein
MPDSYFRPLSGTEGLVEAAARERPDGPDRDERFSHARKSTDPKTSLGNGVMALPPHGKAFPMMRGLCCSSQCDGAPRVVIDAMRRGDEERRNRAGRSSAQDNVANGHSWRVSSAWPPTGRGLPTRCGSHVETTQWASCHSTPTVTMRLFRWLPNECSLVRGKHFTSQFGFRRELLRNRITDALRNFQRGVCALELAYRHVVRSTW